MRPQAYLLLLISIPNLALGSIILARNVRSKVNVFFAAFAYMVGLWALGLAGFIFSQDSTVALYWVQTYYIAAALIAVSFFGFSLAFTHRWKHNNLKRQVMVLIPPVLIVSLILFSPELLARSIVYNSWGKSVELGLGFYSLYSVYFVAYVASGFYFLFRGVRRAAGVERTYLQNILVGFFIAFLLGMTFNLVFPAIGNYRYIWVGPLFTLFYVSFTSYAIIRHRLFDIRLVIARSLGYALSLLTLSALYGFFAFVLISSLGIADSQSATFRQLAYTFVAVILALTFQPLKTFFDKVTARVFYRDSYEPQQLIDNINKILVSTIEVDVLLKRVSELIADTVKASYCGLSLKSRDSQEARIVGSFKEKDIDYEEAKRLEGVLSGENSKVIVTDELLGEQSDLRSALQKNNIAVMIKLLEKSGENKRELGVLVLGPKKSGSPYNSGDVKVLEIIADEMVIAIQNALRFEEIQNFAETLQGRVDEATRKLRKTNEKLKALDETKDEFISMASHQLRTPLTSVKGYVSMVMEGDAGKISKQQQKLLDQAFVSSQRMVYLIADLLNVSRLRTGKFVIEARPTNLADVIEGELKQLTETAKARNLNLVYHKPKDFPVLNLDETKTRQVIMNFVDNAIYYTPNGGTITINLEDKGKSIEFTVVDDGIGVPKSEQHHLFGKFYRAGNAKKARPDGTGLGLFMAKKVIVAQGGSVVFNSQEGKGSTFGFNFPKDKLPEATAKKTTESTSPNILEAAKPASEKPAEAKPKKPAKPSKQKTAKK